MQLIISSLHPSFAVVWWYVGPLFLEWHGASLNEDA
jgi:hypothetical protein